MSAADSDMNFFELDDGTLQMLSTACRSQAVEFDVSKQLIASGFLRVCRDAVLTGFDEDSSAFAEAKACAVRLQGWNFLRLLTQAGVNADVLQTLLDGEFDDLRESLYNLQDNTTLEELSLKLAVIGNLHARGVPVPLNAQNVMESAIGVVLNVVQAASQGLLPGDLDKDWEKKTCQWMYRRKNYFISSERAVSIVAALPHLRRSMRVLAELSNSRELCRSFIQQDEGRVAYFGIALAGELQGRAGDEISFEAARFIANITRHCLTDDENDSVHLSADKKESLYELVTKFGGGTTLHRGLELGLPRIPSVSLRFDPTTTSFRDINNVFAFVSVAVDGFVYSFARSMLALRMHYKGLEAVGANLRLCLGTAARASVGSAAIYLLYELDSVLGRKLIPTRKSNTENFAIGLGVQLFTIAGTAAVLYVAPFSFGAVVLQLAHTEWRKHFKLIDD